MGLLKTSLSLALLAMLWGPAPAPSAVKPDSTRIRRDMPPDPGPEAANPRPADPRNREPTSSWKVAPRIGPLPFQFPKRRGSEDSLHWFRGEQALRGKRYDSALGHHLAAYLPASGPLRQALLEQRSRIFTEL